jgi:hypothetical protein
MPQEKPHNEENQEQSQGEGQSQNSNAAAAQHAHQEEMHTAQNEDVRGYGEPTDGSGGGGDQASTVP